MIGRREDTANGDIGKPAGRPFIGIDIVEYFERFEMGIRVAAIDERSLRRYRIQSRNGVMVTRVIGGSASANIGIQPGDVIRQVNGQPTRDIESFREMVVRARDFPRVQLLLYRSNQGYTLTLQP